MLLKTCIALATLVLLFTSCKKAEPNGINSAAPTVDKYKGYGVIDYLAGGGAPIIDSGATATVYTSSDSTGYEVGISGTVYRFSGSPGYFQGIYTITTYRTYGTDSLEVGGHEPLHGQSTQEFYFKGRKQ